MEKIQVANTGYKIDARVPNTDRSHKARQKKNCTLKKGDMFKNILNYPLIILLTLAIFTVTQASSDECNTLYEVTTSELNIRDNPGKPSNILGTLKKGDTVCVYSFQGKWGQTKYGWMSTKYLKEVSQLESDKDSASHFSSSTVKSVDNNLSNNSDEEDLHKVIVVLGIIIVFSIIIFILNNLFKKSMIALGLAEPDGRSKSGIRWTRLGNFVKGISIFVVILIILVAVSLNGS